MRYAVIAFLLFFLSSTAYGQACVDDGDCEHLDEEPFAVGVCGTGSECEAEFVTPDGPCNGTATACGDYFLFNGTCVLVPNDDDCFNINPASCITGLCELDGTCRFIVPPVIDSTFNNLDDYLFTKNGTWAHSSLSESSTFFDVRVNAFDPSSTTASTGNIFRKIRVFDNYDFPIYQYNGGYLEFDLTMNEGMAVTVLINDVASKCFFKNHSTLGMPPCLPSATSQVEGDGNGLQVPFSIVDLATVNATVTFSFSFIRTCVLTTCEELEIDVNSATPQLTTFHGRFVPNGHLCDMGTFCSVRDECLNDECVTVVIRDDCNDGNVCTIDFCDDRFGADMCDSEPVDDPETFADDFSSGSFDGTTGTIDWRIFRVLQDGGDFFNNPWFELNGDNTPLRSSFSATGTGYITTSPILGVPANTYVFATAVLTGTSSPRFFNATEGTGEGQALARYTPMNRTLPLTSATLMFTFNIEVEQTGHTVSSVMLVEVTEGPAVYENYTLVACYHKFNPTACLPYDPLALNTIDVLSLPMAGVSRLGTHDVTAFQSTASFIRFRVPECNYTLPATVENLCGYVEMAEVALDFSECDDGDLCTVMDMCSGGTCVGMPVDCSGLTTSCLQGVCDPGTGSCVTMPRREGLSCDDGMACTTGDLCNNGTCAGTLNCGQFDSQCTVGACSNTTGDCVSVNINEGLSCNVTTDLLWRTDLVVLGNGSISIFNPFIDLELFNIDPINDVCVQNETCQAGECIGLRPEDAVCDAALGTDCEEGFCMTAAVLNFDFGPGPNFLTNITTICRTRPKEVFAPCPPQFNGTECGFWGCDPRGVCTLFSFDDTECDVFGGSCRTQECNTTSGQCIDGFKRTFFNSPPSVWNFTTPEVHPTGGFIGLLSNTADGFEFESDESPTTMMTLTEVVLANTTFARYNVSIPPSMLKPYERAAVVMNITARSFLPTGNYEFEMEIYVDGGSVLCLRQERPGGILPASICDVSSPLVDLDHNAKTALEAEILPLPAGPTISVEMILVQTAATAGEISTFPVITLAFPGLNILVEDFDFVFLEPGFLDDGTVCNVTGCSNGVCDNCTCANTVTDCGYLNDDCNTGFCNVGLGMCFTVPANEAGVCNDDDPCTTPGTCLLGTCTGILPVDCSSVDDQCNVGVCNATSGMCFQQPANEGAACDDGDLCTVADVCTAGTCGGSPKDCSSEDEQCGTGLCNPVDGMCSLRTPILADGAACTDSGFVIIDCGQTECLGGFCVFVANNTDCDAFEFCINKACNPVTSRCEDIYVLDVPDALTGQPCDNGFLCTTNETCSSDGTCGNGTAVTECDGNLCTLDDVCEIDTCTPGTTLVDCSAFDTDCQKFECVPDTGTCEEIAGAAESVSNGVTFTYFNSTPPADPGLQSVSSGAGEFWVISGTPAASGTGTYFQKTTLTPALTFPSLYISNAEVTISTNIVRQQVADSPDTSTVDNLALSIGTFSTSVDPDLSSQTFDVPLTAFDGIGGTALVTLNYTSVTINCGSIACDRLFLSFDDFDIDLFPVVYEPNTTVCDSGNCLSNGTCDGVGNCDTTNTTFLCTVLDDECNVGACNVTTDTCFPSPINEGVVCNEMCSFVLNDTFLDVFNVSSFSNSDGNAVWGATPWVEVGDDGLPTFFGLTTAGFIVPFSISGEEVPNSYMFTTFVGPPGIPFNTGLGMYIERPVPIAVPSLYDVATLSFDFDLYAAFTPVPSPPVALLVEVAVDGSNFTTLACYHRNNTAVCSPYNATTDVDINTLPLGESAVPAQAYTATLNILPFLATTMAIRFRVPVCNYTGAFPPDPAACAYITYVDVTLMDELCLDLTPCSEQDTCQSGTCTGGPPLNCTFLDGPCTMGFCNTSNVNGCEALPINEGMACDDGDPCTTDTVCSMGTCLSTPVNCSAFDNPPCGVGVCNSTTGMCFTQAVNESMPCDAPNCLSDGVCSGGVCDTSASTFLCAALDNDCRRGVCNNVTDMCMEVYNATLCDAFEVLDCSEKVCNMVSGACENATGTTESVSTGVTFNYTAATPAPSPGPLLVTDTDGAVQVNDDDPSVTGTGTLFQKISSTPSMTFPSSYVSAEVTVTTGFFVTGGTGPGTSAVNNVTLTIGSFSTALSPSAASQMFAVPLAAFTGPGGTALITVNFTSVTIDCVFGAGTCDEFGFGFFDFELELTKGVFLPDGTVCDDGMVFTVNDTCTNGTCIGTPSGNCTLFDVCGVCLTEDDPTNMASVIVVTTLVDVIDPNDGEISIREAVSIANARAGDQEIQVPSGTYEIGLVGDDDENCVGDFDVL